jgi:hypothetical protein
MQISITAFSPSPRRGTARSIFGVGEVIVCEADASAFWSTTADPQYSSVTGGGPHRTATAQFFAPGEYQITATSPGRGDAAHVTVRVVAPRIRFARHSSAFALPSGNVGAGMYLTMTLTPRDVSFSHIEYRERPCDATSVWGYFREHRDRPEFRNTMRHDSRRGAPAGTPEWHAVDQNNVVLSRDLAVYMLRADRLPWPIGAGGFTWLIPVEYRIGTQVFAFPGHVTQSIALSPEDGSSGAPYRGSVTLWKGGQRDRRTFP